MLKYSSNQNKNNNNEEDDNYDSKEISTDSETEQNKEKKNHDEDENLTIDDRQCVAQSLKIQWGNITMPKRTNCEYGVEQDVDYRGPKIKETQPKCYPLPA